MTIKEDKPFNFFIPEVEIEKATNQGGREIMRLKGIAATNALDVDNQILDPQGFDLSYFLNSGFINYNHQSKNDPDAIIGEPTKAEITPNNELYLEAELYADSDVAKKVWNLAKVLQNNSSKRKLGWSIEGITRKMNPIDKRKVMKAMITNVAITPSPKNSTTWVDLLTKGFSYTDEGTAFEEQSQRQGNGGTYVIIEINKENGDKIMIDNHLNVKVVEKALTTEQGSGGSLKKEDLEGKLKNLVEYSGAFQILQKAWENKKINDRQFNIIKQKTKDKILNKK